MQGNENIKIMRFKEAAGKVIKNLRTGSAKLSLNQFAHEYDFDKGNLSKTERGIYNIYLMTAWRISEAAGVKFSEFAKLLEDELGEDFKLIDD